jgi:hypothetical protein
LGEKFSPNLQSTILLFYSPIFGGSRAGRDAGVPICAPPKALISIRDFNDGTTRVCCLIVQIAQLACVSSDPDER